MVSSSTLLNRTNPSSDIDPTGVLVDHTILTRNRILSNVEPLSSSTQQYGSHSIRYTLYSLLAFMVWSFNQVTRDIPSNPWHFVTNRLVAVLRISFSIISVMYLQVYSSHFEARGSIYQHNLYYSLLSYVQNEPDFTQFTLLAVICTSTLLSSHS
jgi:hypothetical protein